MSSFPPTRSAILSVAFGAVLFGCSGGGGVVTEVKARCPGDASFCLTSCNLGCVAGGCTVTEIAQNQPLILEFSQNVDLASVNPATLSIRTASGEAPVGEFTVNGNKVTFTPEVRVSGGTTLFGFQAGAQYRIAMQGGQNSSQSIRSISGDPLNATVNCIVAVSQGIVDLDQTPPQAVLLAPTARSEVPRLVTIEMEFGELIDTSAFQGSSTEFSPIKYELRQPLRDQNGELIRNPDNVDPDTGMPLPIPDPAFVPVRIEGVPRAVPDTTTQTTTVSLTPVIPLPSESWVELTVTDQVRDLSGTPARVQEFSFFTVKETIPDQNVEETFIRGSNLDPQTSSGNWGGEEAVPGAIGGDGRHGSFDVRIGQQLGGPTVYRWNTDNMVIPGDLTLSGNDETVMDGRFYFTDFTLPAGLTLQFVGSKPAQIFVRGRVDIAGTITANAPNVNQDTLYRLEGSPNGPVRFRPRPSTATGPIFGEPPTLGVVGGGSGGRGADSGDGISQQARFNGGDGDDLRLQAGHAYMSRAVGTGGRGTPQFPATGLNADVTFGTFFNTRSGMVGSGGGGGGFFVAGAAGVATETASTIPGDLGPIGPGGRAMNLFADAQGSLPAGTSSLNHFTIGGSGGGGGGSHPFLGPVTVSPPGAIWKAGAAGAPGGGAIVIRAGGSVRIRRSGVIQAQGGNGKSFTEQADGYPMPGGGGSGGSILIQSAVQNGILQEGQLDTRGGFASDAASFLINGRTRGGNGAPGFIRMEAPSGTVDPGDTIPALGSRNIGTLTDTDVSVGAQSRWYSVRQFFSPEFLRYEIEVELDGVPQLLSDDPTVIDPNTMLPVDAADDPTGAVYILFQAAEVNFTSRVPTPETIGRWRKYVGSGSGQAETLNLDSGTGFRFNLIFNRDMHSDVVVKRVTVWFRS